MVGHYTRRGLAFFENGEVATYSHWGTFDFTKGVGPYVGIPYSLMRAGPRFTKRFKGPSSGRLAERCACLQVQESSSGGRGGLMMDSREA